MNVLFDPAFLLLQALNGLSSASSLFIAASGLTLVFGVTRVVNFAHGSLAMIGTYLAATLAPKFMDMMGQGIGFWAAILIAVFSGGLVAVIMEYVLLRRIYHRPELFQLLATFGVVLVIQETTTYIFGPEDILGPRAPYLSGAILIFNQRFPIYDLFLIAAGLAVLMGLWLLLHTTRLGILIRAATSDREMVEALGVDQKRLFQQILFLGGCLAGLGGALLAPKIPAHSHMDLPIVVDCFVVTVIGGMGSIPGAFLASLIIGQIQAFGILVFPKITLVLIFLLMGLVLAFKPWGLLGRAESLSHATLQLVSKPISRKWLYAGFVWVFFLPFVADSYLLKTATEILILSLFAFSLYMLVVKAGMVSFGHAAFFGLGAYGAALSVKYAELSMELALAVAPLAGVLGGLVVGPVLVRRTGIYMAMLSLAFAQILYALAFQWVEITGGDNGLIGLWPSAWAASRLIYYLLSVTLVGLSVFIIFRVLASPFGMSLLACRDSEQRAGAIGLVPARIRWMAICLAGGMAGLAGGLSLFLKGSVDPSVLGISMSVDALVMILLGGLNSVVAPFMGTMLFQTFKETLMPLTDFWRFFLGLLIISIILLRPSGFQGKIKAV